MYNRYPVIGIGKSMFIHGVFLHLITPSGHCYSHRGVSVDIQSGAQGVGVDLHFVTLCNGGQYSLFPSARSKSLSCFTTITYKIQRTKYIYLTSIWCFYGNHRDHVNQYSVCCTPHLWNASNLSNCCHLLDSLLELGSRYLAWFVHGLQLLS